VKFAWSDYYRGGPVDGNFGWLNEQQGTPDEGHGHEALNFLPGPDGTYYCYVPPQLGNPPSREGDNTGWTVVCLSKQPKYKGIHVIGWYENATLLGEWKERKLNLKATESDTPYFDCSYCITSKSAFFVPPELRNNPFSDPAVKRGKFSYLAGPGIEATENRRRVLALLEKKLKSLREIAIHAPNETNAPDPELDQGDPLIGFGTPEHRKAVELAAEEAVKNYYRNKRFRIRRVADLKCGYDYIFSKDDVVRHVEVKGTSMANEQFYLTRNEYDSREAPEWRLAMVTNALSEKPNVKIYDNKSFKKAFDLEPYVYIGKRIYEPERG